MKIKDIIEEASKRISIEIKDCLMAVAKGESNGDEIESLIKSRNNLKKLWRRVRIKERELIRAGHDTSDLINMVRDEINK